MGLFLLGSSFHRALSTMGERRKTGRVQCKTNLEAGIRGGRPVRLTSTWHFIYCLTDDFSARGVEDELTLEYF